MPHPEGSAVNPAPFASRTPALLSTLHWDVSRSPACLQLAQVAPWESDPPCADGLRPQLTFVLNLHLVPPPPPPPLLQPPLGALSPCPLQPPFVWHASPCSWSLPALPQGPVLLGSAMSLFRYWQAASTVHGHWRGILAVTITWRVTSACDAFTLPTSSSSALTKRARWMALGGKTTQTVSSWHARTLSKVCTLRCELGLTMLCDVIPFHSYGRTLLSVNFYSSLQGFSMALSLRTICVVFRARDRLLGKEGIPRCDIAPHETAATRKPP